MYLIEASNYLEWLSKTTLDYFAPGGVPAAAHTLRGYAKDCVARNARGIGHHSRRERQLEQTLNIDE